MCFFLLVFVCLSVETRCSYSVKQEETNLINLEAVLNTYSGLPGVGMDELRWGYNETIDNA